MNSIAPMIISRARIICPVSGTDEIGTVRTVDGRIDAVVFDGSLDEAEGHSVDAKGAVLTTGFTEIYAHCGEPGREDTGDLNTLSASAVKGGFSTVCVSPLSSPPIDNRGATEYVKRRSGEIGGAEILPLGCVSIGGRGERLTEMFDLATGGAVAFTDGETSSLNSALFRRVIEYSQAVGIPVLDFPGEPDLTGAGVMNEGLISTQLGLKGIPVAAEEVRVCRAIAIARQTGAHVHIGPISAGVSVDLIERAKGDGLSVTSSVHMAHLHLVDEDIGSSWSTNLRLEPPLRTAHDRARLVEGLATGVIDVVSSGHHPVGLVDKQVPFSQAIPGMVGLETCLGLGLRLVEQGAVGLSQVLGALSKGPAQVLRRESLGVQAGSRADIVLFQPANKFLVEAPTLATRAHNTAFLGQALPGEVQMTLVAGRVAYRSDALEVARS